MTRRDCYKHLHGLPNHKANSHFLYVAEFKDGAIKVGVTFTPAARSRSLSKERSLVLRMSAASVCADLFSRFGFETDLVARLARIGNVISGSREYFTGVRFGEAKTIMKQVAARSKKQVPA
jgi:hypothetical protein